MTGLEIFFIMFLVMIVIGLAVFFMILKSRLQTEETENDIVWNLISNRCNKRSTGVVKDISVGRKGRILFTYIPKDVNEDTESEKEVRVIVDKFIDVPRGDISKDRGLKILLPKNSEDLPKSIKQTDLGKKFSRDIEQKNVENNIIESLRESRNRQDTLQLLQGGGELSKSEIKRRNELLDELSALLVKGAEKKHGGE